VFARASVEGPKYEPALIRLAPWLSTYARIAPADCRLHAVEARRSATRQAELQWLFAVAAAAGDLALSDLHEYR